MERFFVIASAVLLLALGITTPVEAAQLIYGNEQPLGNGIVRAWLLLDSSKNPTSIGLTFSEAALSDLPQQTTRYLLSFPQRTSAMGFQDIEITWNPKGHPPNGVYDVPHFDFHFYLTNSQERNQITAIDEDLAKDYASPPPEFIPTDYILAPGTAAPGEGSHWADKKAPEFQRKPFNSSLLYGFYNGKMSFFEPLIPKSSFDSKENFSQNIKQPSVYSKDGYYPEQYSMDYNSMNHEYSVSLDDLKFRQAEPLSVPEPALNSALLLGACSIGIVLRQPRK